MFSVSVSPSLSSNLCGKSDISGSSISTLMRSTEELELERARSRSRSRSVNTSLAWSLDTASSDTTRYNSYITLL